MKLFRTEDITEKQIVEGVRKGSETAMKELYDCWSGYLFALCTRYIPDRSKAEDVLQESMIKIFSSFDSFEWKGSGSLKAWMSRITVNEALQYIRKNRKMDFLEYKDSLPDMDDAEDSDLEIEKVPSSMIQKFICSLPDGYRTIFNLFVFEEKSHKEIASLLGISESTSASQYHRAKKMLARKISDYIRQIPK